MDETLASAMTLTLSEEVVDERVRQDAKWGTSFEGRDPNTWLAILMEEVGEAAAEIDPDKLIVELIQVAAVALSWAEHVPTQGRTNQFPEGPTLRLDTMLLGDRARDILQAGGID